MGPFSLELNTDKVIVQPPRRYSPAEQVIIKAKTQELADTGAEHKHKGPTRCAVNPVVAAKKDPDTGMGTDHRMEQDYRFVNQHTPHYLYGMHRPEERFQKVSKDGVFSKHDLRQGFLHIPVIEGNQAKTCSWVGNRLMAYCRMPYRLGMRLHISSAFWTRRWTWQGWTTAPLRSLMIFLSGWTRLSNTRRTSLLYSTCCKVNALGHTLKNPSSVQAL